MKVVQGQFGQDAEKEVPVGEYLKEVLEAQDSFGQKEGAFVVIQMFDNGSMGLVASHEDCGAAMMLLEEAKHMLLDMVFQKGKYDYED